MTARWSPASVGSSIPMSHGPPAGSSPLAMRSPPASSRKSVTPPRTGSAAASAGQRADPPVDRPRDETSCRPVSHDTVSAGASALGGRRPRRDVRTAVAEAVEVDERGSNRPPVIRWARSDATSARTVGQPTTVPVPASGSRRRSLASRKRTSPPRTPPGRSATRSLHSPGACHVRRRGRVSRRAVPRRPRPCGLGHRRRRRAASRVSRRRRRSIPSRGRVVFVTVA
jgi:hypothetical protein